MMTTMTRTWGEEHHGVVWHPHTGPGSKDAEASRRVDALDIGMTQWHPCVGDCLDFRVTETLAEEKLASKSEKTQ